MKHIFSMRSIMKNKKGVSPVIATILLVGMVVVIGLIIFSWLSSFTEENITKFDKNAASVCEEIKFEVGYSEGKLLISNTGNIPIYEMSVKISEPGSFKTENINDLSSAWPDSGLNQGRGFSDAVDFSGAESITLTPIILGSVSGGEKTFACDETRFGNGINL